MCVARCPHHLVIYINTKFCHSHHNKTKVVLSVSFVFIHGSRKYMLSGGGI